MLTGIKGCKWALFVFIRTGQRIAVILLLSDNTQNVLRNIMMKSVALYSCGGNKCGE